MTTGELMLALCMSLLALLLHPRAQHQFYGTNRRNSMQMNHPIRVGSVAQFHCMEIRH